MSNIFKSLTSRIGVADKLKRSSSQGTHKYKTQIFAGYGLYQDEHGISQLKENIWEVPQENQVVLGGSLFILSKVFGVNSSLNVDDLNTIMGIGTGGKPITEKYPKENVICGFTVGIDGCGASYKDVKAVKHQDRQVPGMIPFRVTDTPLEGEEKKKYWFHKQLEDGKHAYYVKRFEDLPKIKSLWRDAPDGQDGSPVTDGAHESDRLDGIETFVEIIIQFSPKDLIEYFELYEGIEDARFNSIGLVTGIEGEIEDGSKELKQVIQATILTFGNELLHMDKDLTMIYRVFG